jgi:hypothetical protein
MDSVAGGLAWWLGRSKTPIFDLAVGATSNPVSDPSAYQKRMVFLSKLR